MKKPDVSIRIKELPERLATLRATEARIAWIVFHTLGGNAMRIRRFVHALAAPPNGGDAPSNAVASAGAESTATQLRSLLDKMATATAGSPAEAEEDRRLAQHVRLSLGGDGQRLACLVDEIARLTER
jgi:hypothetical protein